MDGEAEYGKHIEFDLIPGGVNSYSPGYELFRLVPRPGIPAQNEC